MVGIVDSRKGLSPIFASIIILAIITVLFTPIFIWSTGLTANTRSFWENMGVIATERIVIEEVNLIAGETSCTIYVRNIGKTAIIVDNIFIDSPGGTLQVYDGASFSTDFNSVVQGDLMTVTIPALSSAPSSGEIYTVKVFTTRGVGDTYQVVT